MKKQIIIGSRGSKLALIQSDELKNLLQEIHPQIDIKVKAIPTRGDKILNKPLSEIGGKGLFTAELEEGLIAHEIDLAVHSLKDLPSQLDKGLKYAGSPRREDVRDALISKHWNSIQDIPEDGIIATGSVRRKAQLLAVRPDLNITNLRGNVDARLKKLNKNNWDGIIVAAAAMHRLNCRNLISEYLDPTIHVPPAGQGALGFEIAEDRSDMDDILKSIIDDGTTLACITERSLLKKLGGDCSVPVGCYATLNKNNISITGYLADEAGVNRKLKTVTGSSNNAEMLAQELADHLLKLTSKQNISI